MKVYLTGEGFVGKHIKSRLLNELPLDYTHIPHDRIKNTKINNFDYFFFLSTYGNLAHHSDESMVYKANIEDLIATIRQLPDLRFRSFLFMSTSSVKLKTQTTYSRSKRAAEEILLATMEKFNLPICVVRPFSITGYGEQAEHLIPTLIRAAYSGEQVNLVPKPTHDYIDVQDVVDGMMSLVENGARGIFELGTGIKTSNEEVLRIVEKLTGKKIKVNIINNLRDYDSDNWISTNFKARGYGWLPKKTLEQSIKEQIDDYRRAREEN